MDLDDLDIYEDLDTFQKEEEKKSVELLSLESKYHDSLKTIESLQAQNAGLQKQIKRIEINFQNLLDTAKSEIKRKDKQIEQLRKEKDDICFRRKLPGAEYANAFITSQSFNSRIKNEAAAYLPQNCKTEYNRRAEYREVPLDVKDAKQLVTTLNSHHTTDARSITNKREKNSRADGTTGRKFESDLSLEKDTRSRPQRDQHAHRPRSRERRRSTTRDYERNNARNSTQRMRREEHESRNKRSYVHEKDRDYHNSKSDDGGRRQHSYEKPSDRPRHNREHKNRHKNIDGSRERYNENKKTDEVGNKKITDTNYRIRDKSNKNMRKNNGENLVNNPDDAKCSIEIPIEPTKDAEGKHKNAEDIEQVPISKVFKNDKCTKSSKVIESTSRNKISYENLPKDTDPNKSVDKSAADILTKEKLLALETATDKNSNCMPPTEGMTSPKKAALFNKLFGCTPSNAETVNNALLNNAMVILKSNSNSVTTSPSNYTDNSEQIMLSSKTSSEKSEIDECSVPINFSNISKKCEYVITLSDSSDSNDVHIPGLGNTPIAVRGQEQAIMTEEVPKGTRETAKTAKEIENTVSIVVSDDDEDFIAIENILEKNEAAGGVKKMVANNLTSQVLTKIEQNFDSKNGELKTLANVRLPNIYEKRAQLRLLRAEAAKNAKSSDSPNMKATTSSLVQKTPIICIKESLSGNNKSIGNSKNLTESRKDVDLHNHNIKSKTASDAPLEECIEVGNNNSTIIGVNANQEMGARKINEKKKVEYVESKKQIVTLSNPVEVSNANDSKVDLMQLKPLTESIAEKQKQVIPMENKRSTIELKQREYSCQTTAEKTETASKIEAAAVVSTGKKFVAHVVAKTECHTTLAEVEKTSAVVVDCDQSINNTICVQKENTLFTYSNDLENNSNKETNATVPSESAVEIKNISESLVGKAIHTAGVVQKVLNEEMLSGGEREGDKVFVEQKIIDESKIIHEAKIVDGQNKVSAEQKVVDSQTNSDMPKTNNERHISKEQKKKSAGVQKVADEIKQVAIAKQYHAEPPNESVSVIENTKSNKNTNKILISGKSKSSTNNADVEGLNEEKSKTIPTDQSSSQIQSFSKNKKQKNEDGGNSKTEEHQTKTPSGIAESESKEFEDALAYLIKSMGTQKEDCLVATEMEAQLQTEKQIKQPTKNEKETSTNLSATANSDSNIQTFAENNKQNKCDDKNVAMNNENFKINEYQTKTPDVIAESECKEVEDALAYLIKSMGTQKENGLDGTEVETKLQSEKQSEEAVDKVVEAQSKQSKDTAESLTDPQSSKIMSTELSTCAKSERNALIDNMKRAEIMWKFKIPKISAKRKRENDDETNNLKESAEIKEASENDTSKIVLVGGKVEEHKYRKKNRTKKDANPTVKNCLDLDEEETEIVKIDSNIEKELIDVQLLNGRTPEEKQALSAEQAKSERIIKEIDNWARRKVGKSAEIIENAVVLEPNPNEKMEEQINTVRECKLVSTSTGLEEQQKTGTKTKQTSGNDKLSTAKDQQLEYLKNTPRHLPNKRCKYEMSADTETFIAHTNQKTDNQQFPEESNNESETQISIIKYPIINKKKSPAIKERRKSQGSGLTAFREEINAEDGESSNRKDLNAVATEAEQCGKSQLNVKPSPFEEKTPTTGRVEDGERQSAQKPHEAGSLTELEQKAKAVTTSTEVVQKLNNEECGNKIDRKHIPCEQLESKTKITQAKATVCSNSQLNLIQNVVGTQKYQHKCDYTKVFKKNHISAKEKQGNAADGRKRASEKQITGLSKSAPHTERNEKRAKLLAGDTGEVETVHKKSDNLNEKQVPSTKQLKTATANAALSKVVSSCNATVVNHSKIVPSSEDSTVEQPHAKLTKRRRSDASTSDECEVMPTSRNRKRCKMRIEDSEDEEGCAKEPQLTQKPHENSDILDILQNDRANESNNVLPAPQTPTSLPANISQDEQYMELDSRLEVMFASPKVHEKTAIATQVRVVPKLAGDIAKTQPLTPAPQVEQSPQRTPVSSLPLIVTEAPLTNAMPAVDFNISDTFLSDISSSSLQMSHMNVTIDETNMNSSLSDSNSSTKHISLGSSAYRFEKVSDNVVNLFITRKRRGKRKQTTATTTTAAAATTTNTIPTT